MRDAVAWIVFVIVQAVFLPLAVLGVVLYGFAELVVSRRLGVSGTAGEIAAYRFMMDRFGLREDAASVRLVRALPTVSVTGLWLLLFPWWLRSRLSGRTFGLFGVPAAGRERPLDVIVARTLYIDRIIEKALGRVGQLVSLGAGDDTRSFGRLKAAGLQFFELDRAATQRVKRQALQRVGVDASHVHFVEVDFSADDWTQALVRAGFEPDRPALFLWEGVTMYLSEAAVRQTLRAIKAVAAPGSTIVCDFASERVVTGRYSRAATAAVKSHGGAGEGMVFGLDLSKEDALASFLGPEGISCGDVYYLGSRTRKGTYWAVAELTVPPHLRAGSRAA